MDAKDLDLDITGKPAPVEILKSHAVEMLGRELTVDELAIVNKTVATFKSTPAEMLKTHAVEMLGRELTDDEVTIVKKTAATLAAIKRHTRKSIKSTI